MDIQKKLTNRQAIFVREIAKGRTHRQACLIAYPKSKNWNTKTVDARANALMKNSVVLESLDEIYKNEQNQIFWNRKKATKILLDLMEKVEQEQRRIERSYNELLKIQCKKINDIEKMLQKAKTSKARKTLQSHLLKAKKHFYNYSKKNVINSSYSITIIKCVQLLNKMNGYTNFNCIKNSIEPTITAEELKKIIYNKNKQNI